RQAQDDAFDALEEAVNASLKDTKSTELQEQILKVALVLLKKDPTQFAGEVILPFYEKNRKGFEASLKSLSEADSSLILKAVKAAAREKARGNG
ncbi:MAG: phosphoenolpyruvate carboxylase, partial [Bdellovibrio sp.]|nr:phosphoenolpyruvate carboxylase [Bdellovibrio sp.]